MSGVTRTFTRKPSVARFRAARFSSGVLYFAGRLSSATLSGLSGSGLPFVCVFAMDSMLATIVPADPDITGSRMIARLQDARLILPATMPLARGVSTDRQAVQIERLAKLVVD